MARFSSLTAFLVVSAVQTLTNAAVYDREVYTAFEARDNTTFSWSNLAASKQLEWKDCYTGRQCARLTVPLDYKDPEGREATIAIIRKPATVSAEAYRGPVLFNPGGPGGSGVAFIAGPEGDLFSTILGPEFDIVGFDPRGIGHSTPRVSFFKTNVERAILGPLRVSVVNNSDDGIVRTWARNKVVGQLAAEQDDGYLKHINTDQTARDMLKIVEAHGREKIQYWGFSYGTVLGATFAAMFPDKIDRLILDGVADAPNYYATLWSTSLVDTDKTLQAFFTGCVDAGPTVCPFHEPTADAIRQKLNNLYETVRKNPIPVYTNTTYGLLDYNGLRTAVFTMLYSPWAGFQIGAQALAAVAAGDGRLMFSILNPPEAKFVCGEESDPPMDDSQGAILCNDGDEVPGDLQSSQEYFDMMVGLSEWGQLWSSTRLACVGWPKFPKDHFQGPFVANTSHPIMLIGNTADPVTPLWAAKKMSTGFNGSVVLTQNSPGHCSTSAPSVCTMQFVKAYFVNGTLPDPDTVCETDSKPFDVEDQSDLELRSTLTGEEKERWDAAKQLSKMAFTRGFL